MPNMTRRPGYRTMEMNGGSSAPYLACTPCVPLFVHCLIRVEAEGLLDYQGRAGIISIVRWNLRPVRFGVEKTKEVANKKNTKETKTPRKRRTGKCQRVRPRAAVPCVRLIGHLDSLRTLATRTSSLHRATPKPWRKIQP